MTSKNYCIVKGANKALKYYKEEELYSTIHADLKPFDKMDKGQNRLPRRPTRTKVKAYMGAHGSDFCFMYILPQKHLSSEGAESSLLVGGYSMNENRRAKQEMLRKMLFINEYSKWSRFKLVENCSGRCQRIMLTLSAAQG